MKKLMGICVLSGMFLVGCGDGTNSLLDPGSSLLPEASEELMSQNLVDDAVGMTDEADVADVRIPAASDAFPVDVRESDRLCRISDRTIQISENMTAAAKDVYDLIHTVFPTSASDETAAAFARASLSLNELVVGGSTCRRIVVQFVVLARSGMALQHTLRREHLLRQNDRLPLLVRKARAEFEHLIKALRHDISGQASDVRRARDGATSNGA